MRKKARIFGDPYVPMGRDGAILCMYFEHCSSHQFIAERSNGLAKIWSWTVTLFSIKLIALKVPSGKRHQYKHLSRCIFTDRVEGTILTALYQSWEFVYNNEHLWSHVKLWISRTRIPSFTLSVLSKGGRGYKSHFSFSDSKPITNRDFFLYLIVLGHVTLSSAHKIWNKIPVKSQKEQANLPRYRTEKCNYNCTD